jgi:hypothetical protein
MLKLNSPDHSSYRAVSKAVIQTCARSILIFGMGLAVVAGTVRASTITSVTCATPTAVLATGAASCDAIGLYGYSQAVVSTGITLPGTATDAAVIQASSSASALQTGVHGIVGTATAQSSAEIGIIFDTTGPVRSGLLELSFLQNTWDAPLNGYLSQSLAIGSYSANPNGSSLSSIWIPIELGSQFGFDYTQSIAAIGSSIGGLSTGSIDSQMSLLAFEADGITAVQLYDPPGSPSNLFTPEPANIGIMAIGLFSLILFVKLRA